MGSVDTAGSLLDLEMYRHFLTIHHMGDDLMLLKGRGGSNVATLEQHE